MIKSLTKHGNSHAIILDRTILDQLGITPETPVQVTVSDGHLTITPVHVGLGTDRVNDLMKKVRNRYSSTLKKLAK
ncbi:MAG: AbrB/MazE/SpoVT family DNA-binding domain-containing protein [Phycisphaeraceae bacterium]|nr:hypothetical protein [Phycisphaerales bacterium]MCB9859330.1 AbrB/MazE/SpoVT family DNA-binding domain-containing protein [Phycisphaeraceae bacterium]